MLTREYINKRDPTAITDATSMFGLRMDGAIAPTLPTIGRIVAGSGPSRGLLGILLLGCSNERCIQELGLGTGWPQGKSKD